MLEEVTRQRSRYAPEAPVAEQGAVSAATTSAVRSLFAVVEAYPQVRSQENVLRLQGEIERLEGQLADRRELYNDQVYRYNTTIAQVPAVVLAAMLGWRSRAFFAAGAGAEEELIQTLGGYGQALYGSPAEEIVASRPYMIRAGLFEGVDAVIDNHSALPVAS